MWGVRVFAFCTRKSLILQVFRELLHKHSFLYVAYEPACPETSENGLRKAKKPASRGINQLTRDYTYTILRSTGRVAHSRRQLSSFEASALALTMAPAALPLAKIGSLLIKTLSKPVAKRIKKDFARYETTQRLLVGLGQSTHRLTTRMTIWSEGFTVRSIPPLEEKEAIQKGADLLGESIVFGVSVGVLIWEFYRSANASKAKEEKRLREIEAENDDMEEKLHSLDVRIEALEKAVKAQNNSLYLYSGQRYVAPPKEELKPIPVPRKMKLKKMQANNDTDDGDYVNNGDSATVTREGATYIDSSRTDNNASTRSSIPPAARQEQKVMFHVGADEVTGNPGRLVSLEDIVSDLEQGLSSRSIEEEREKVAKQVSRWGGWWPF